jgi:hydroxypyruvate isomerase
MTKLAANLTMLFNEQAFLDRFEAAARAVWSSCFPTRSMPTRLPIA